MRTIQTAPSAVRRWALARRFGRPRSEHVRPRRPSGLDCSPEPRRRRARVRRDLLRGRPDRLPGRTRSEGSFPHTQTGKSGGQVQPCASARKNRLTIRSSSEWKLITAIRPPGASISSAAGSAASSAPSSSFTAIRSASKTRRAGCPRRTAPASGLQPDRLHQLARRLQRLLPPFARDPLGDLPGVALFAVRAEDLRQLARSPRLTISRAETSAVGSILMSSGASAAYEKPRSGRSSCMLETPRSKRTARRRRDRCPRTAPARRRSPPPGTESSPRRAVGTTRNTA